MKHLMHRESCLPCKICALHIKMVADFSSDDTQFANALATFKSKRREGRNNNKNLELEIY